MSEMSKLDPQVPEGAPGGLQRVASASLVPYRPLWREVDEEEETISLKNLLAVLRRRKWLVIAVLAGIFVLGAIQVLTTRPRFTSVALLQVDPESPKVLPYEAVTDDSFSPNSSQEYLGTQARKLQSLSVARRVVEKHDLAQDPRFNEEISRGVFLDAISATLRGLRRLFAPPPMPTDQGQANTLAGKLLENVGVLPVRDTRLLELSYTSPYPDLSARIVNTLAEEFIEQHFESQYESTTRVAGFLEGQLNDLHREVETSEEELNRYARENNIVNLSEREELSERKLTDLTASLNDVESRLASERGRLEAARFASADNFPEGLKNEVIRGVENRLVESRQRLSALSATFGRNWPELQSVQEEVSRLEDQLRAARQTAIQAAGEDYRLLSGQRAALQAALDEQRQAVDGLRDRVVEFNTLQGEVDSNRELYRGLLQRLKEAGVEAGLRSSNIRVAEVAQPPNLPSAPNTVVDLLLALATGLVLGVAAAFVVEGLDNTIKGGDDVASHLRLPALGMIPTVMASGAGRSGLRFGRKRAELPGPVLVYGDSSLEWRKAWEAYRSLRTSILLSHSGKPPRTIMVTSPFSGEGKTMTVINSGAALAQTGARTLLVDLDLRNPGLGEVFGLDAQQGMSTFLSGNSDLSSQVRETSIPNLFVVPAGPTAPNPPELIGSERMRTGIELLHEYFTYIVIDTPPVLEVTDAAVLSPRVDGVILVVRSGKTPREAVRRATRRLVAVGGHFLGVLVNDVDPKALDFGLYGDTAYYTTMTTGPELGA